MEVDAQRAARPAQATRQPMTGTLETERSRASGWRSAIWAGIVAGAVFMILEMLLVQLLGLGSMWAPPRMIATIVMGRDVLPPPDTFDARVVGAASASRLLHLGATGPAYFLCENPSPTRLPIIHRCEL